MSCETLCRNGLLLIGKTCTGMANGFSCGGQWRQILMDICMNTLHFFLIWSCKVTDGAKAHAAVFFSNIILRNGTESYQKPSRSWCWWGVFPMYFGIFVFFLFCTLMFCMPIRLRQLVRPHLANCISAHLITTWRRCVLVINPWWAPFWQIWFLPTRHWREALKWNDMAPAAGHNTWKLFVPSTADRRDEAGGKPQPLCAGCVGSGGLRQLAASRHHRPESTTTVKGREICPNECIVA